MIEAFGARNSVLIIAGVNICAAILVLAASGLKPVFAGAISITIVGTALIIAVTLPRWDRIRMSASFFDPLDKVEEAIDVLFYKEDAYGVTSVLYARPLAQKFLVTNRNYIQSASSTAGLEDHRRLGHIPLLLHPHPEHVAVIGMGTGVTLRGVAAHNPATIDCAEISAAVFGAAAYFSDENGDVTKNGAINFIIEDGRNFLAFAGKSYDVIVCDVLFPMSAGAGYMFTTDYFKLLKRRLRPGGLACVWVPLSQLPSADVRTIAASFKKEFPHTTLWLGTAGESIPVLGCIGTQTPLRIYYSDLSERLANTRIAAELSQINLDDPSLFLSNFIMGSEGIGKFTENSPLNTDNLPVIEFSTPLLSVDYPAQGAANLNAIICDAHSVVPYLAAFPADDSAADSIIREIELSARARKTLISGIAASMSGHPAAALARFRAVLQQQPESPDASLLIAQLVPSLQHDLLSKGDDLYRQDSQQDALKTYRAIVEADPSTPLAYQAFLRIGTLLLENRKSDEAAAALEEALAHFPSDPRLITLAAEAAGQ
jgi:spermidine synthase